MKISSRDIPTFRTSVATTQLLEAIQKSVVHVLTTILPVPFSKLNY